MAPNNGLANAKPKSPANDVEPSSPSSQKTGSTTILRAGTVESRGSGSANSPAVISEQIQEFLTGEGRLSLRAEVRGFFTVWTFVTRLPGPTWVDHHPGYLMRGMAFFPSAGCLVGTFVSAFFDLGHAALGLPLSVASAASEAASLWITGCFHEDGLADAADGIGGGWSREEILRIMTDTRLGTYGCAVLLLYVIVKLELVASLGKSVWVRGACEGGGPAIVVTHTLARLTAPLLIKTNDYVDEQGPKYKFYSFFVEAKHLVTWSRVIFATVSSFAVASLAYGCADAMLLILSVILIVIFSGRYANYLLGGVMGDYLGATICVTEAVLLGVLVLLDGADERGGHAFLLILYRIVSLGREYWAGARTFPQVMDEVQTDDPTSALLRFLLVASFTALWCRCVGHPPVFVRTTVVANKDAPQIRIALSPPAPLPADRTPPRSALDAALADPARTFAERHAAARLYLDALAKPPGSLGTLEEWAARLAALQRTSAPRVRGAACLVFAGDHGVARDGADGGRGCSAYPQAVTGKVLEGLARGKGGASVLAAQQDVFLRVIDVGVAGRSGKEDDAAVGRGKVVVTSEHKIVGGTNNFCESSAMTPEEMDGCMVAGRQAVKACIKERGPTVLVFGEVGIGNTTTSSVLIAALTGSNVNVLCGSGATTVRDHGDKAAIAKKISIVKEALAKHGGSSAMIDRPVVALQKVGGAEIAALVGAILEASDNNIAVLVDGFIVTTAAMIACQMNPNASRVLFFATKSTEQGQTVAMETIQNIASDNQVPAPTKPALDMHLRMGEGTGALMAVPLIKSAVTVLSNLATLDEVLNLASEKEDDPVC